MELYELEEARNDVLDALEDGCITMEDAEDMIGDIDLLVEASKKEADIDAKIGRYMREVRAARNHRTLSEPKGSDYEKYKKDIRKTFSNNTYDDQTDNFGRSTRGQKPNADDPKAPHKYKYAVDRSGSFNVAVHKNHEKEYKREMRNRNRYKKWLERKGTPLKNGKGFTVDKKYSDMYDALMDASEKRDRNTYSKVAIASNLVSKVKDGKIAGATADKIRKRYPKAFKESAYEVLDNIHSFLEEAYND